jgi:hypothetical protein
MWGNQGAFSTNHPLYVFLRALTQLRDSEPAPGIQHMETAVFHGRPWRR